MKYDSVLLIALNHAINFPHADLADGDLLFPWITVSPSGPSGDRFHNLALQVVRGKKTTCF